MYIRRSIWGAQYFSISAAARRGRWTVLGVLGLVGLCGTLDKVVLPWLEKGGADKWVDDGEKLVYMGLFREDLKMAKRYIILFIASAYILCSLTAGMIHKGTEFALCLLSFSSMIPLLGISLMFRFASEAAGRKSQLATLRKIGYAKEQIKTIVRQGIIVAVRSYYGGLVDVYLQYHRGAVHLRAYSGDGGSGAGGYICGVPDDLRVC